MYKAELQPHVNDPQQNPMYMIQISHVKYHAIHFLLLVLLELASITLSL
jgi:hypothetical protein